MIYIKEIIKQLKRDNIKLKNKFNMLNDDESKSLAIKMLSDVGLCDENGNLSPNFYN